MSPTPHEIQTKEFREAFRGYNQDDVDQFLDEIADDHAKTAQENQRLRVQVAALQQELARLEEGGAPRAEPRSEGKGEAREEMKRALAAAQSAAESLLQEARSKADEIIADAERRSAQASEQLAARATASDTETGSAVEDDLQWRVEELRRQEVETRKRLRDLLEEQLQALDRVDAQSRHTATVERMSRELSDGEEQGAGGRRFWTEPES